VKFTPTEDNFLRWLVSTWGEGQWKEVAARMPGRSVRQCRERWKLYLDPSLIHSEWTPAEDQLLLSQFDLCGARWAHIATYFPGRTDVDAKNRYQKIQRKHQKASKKSHKTLPQFPSVDDVLNRAHPPPPPFPLLDMPSRASFTPNVPPPPQASHYSVKKAGSSPASAE
jgi:hypothetical protein